MPYVWTICLVAACGGLLFGYDWVVIGGAKPFYEAYFGITDPAQSGWAMSSALVGCIFGAVISGLLSDRFGRKLPLAIAALTFVISAPPWPPVLTPLSFTALSAGSALAWLRRCRRCISPKSARRHSGVASLR
jgi:MFS family permease